MNNLATIQKVTNVRNHPNGDALDLVQVLGWQVVTKRGEYKDGDLCVYVAIDTILPEKPEFEFLRNKNFRIKPIRLRGEASAGIVFPINIVPGFVALTPNGDGFHFNRKNDHGEDHGIHELGDDVSELLGIKHYEKPVPTELAGQAFGHMPGFLSITDEDNLRSFPTALPEMFGRPYYITRKDDGCSGTFFVNGGEFGVCSRRIHLKDTEGNGFWKMARKYDIENILKSIYPDKNIAIQGEVVGPGIQKNNLGLADLELHIFNLFDISRRTYMSYESLIQFCQTSGIPMVHTIQGGSAFGFTLEELIELANKQMYYFDKDKTRPAEGIVIRPQESFTSVVLKKSWSGKVLNENYKE